VSEAQEFFEKGELCYNNINGFIDNKVKLLFSLLAFHSRECASFTGERRGWENELAARTEPDFNIFDPDVPGRPYKKRLFK
jgi:hypothetical protein